jgi:hypothetical protein
MMKATAVGLLVAMQEIDSSGGHHVLSAADMSAERCSLQGGARLPAIHDNLGGVPERASRVLTTGAEDLDESVGGGLRNKLPKNREIYLP